MKVVKIEVFLTAAVWRNFLFVKLTTDEGIVGWGDGTLEWKESTVRDLILDLGRRYVIGHNPFDIESIWFQLYQVEHNTGPIMYAAMAGIETALWDIVGKGDWPARLQPRRGPRPEQTEGLCEWLVRL